MNHLTPKDIEWIQKYTNPNSPTYSQKTKTTMDVFGVNYGPAATKGTELAKKPAIRNEMQRIMQRMAAGVEVRAQIMGSIALGNHVHTVKTRTTGTNKNGDTIDMEVTTERPPTPAEIINANKEINKLEGRHAIVDAAKKVFSDDLAHALREQRKQSDVVADAVPADSREIIERGLLIDEAAEIARNEATIDDS